MHLKFLPPLSGIILGIYLASDIFTSIGIGLTALGAALGAWLIITLLSRKPAVGMAVAKWHWIWVFLLFTGIGYLDFFFISKADFPETLEGKEMRMEGVIKDIKYLSNGDKFTLDILSVQDSGLKYTPRNFKMVLNTDGFSGATGDIISFKAIPKKIEKDKVSPYNEQLLHQGITYKAYARNDRIHKTGEISSLLSFFNRQRENFTILLEKSSLNRETSSFLISILLGDKFLLSTETRDKLSSAGLAHVLALSGMHVGIIISILYALFFPMALLGWHKTRKMAIILIIWIYVAFTGFSPSTVRAAFMATTIITAYLLERKNSTFNSLLAAGFFLLLFNPYNLWDIGFQLSFTCVAAILLFTSRLNPVDHHHHPLLFKITNIVLITLISTICTWALVSYYFKNIPLMFLPSNLLLLPLLPIFVGTGALYTLLLATGIDFNFPARFLDLFFHFFINTADWLSLSGTANIRLQLTLPSLLLWMGGIIAIALTLYSKSRNMKVYGSVAGMILIVGSLSFIFLPMQEKERGTLRIPHSFTKIEAHIISPSDRHQLIFPRKNISRSESDNCKILAVDRVIHSDSLSKLKETSGKNENIKSSYLIVGSNASSSQIAELINSGSFSNVVLHAGVGKNKKSEIIDLTNEEYREKIHSLRESGSLEFDL